MKSDLLKEAALICMASLCTAALWFFPVFWDLAPEESSFLPALFEVFFQTSELEFYLGEGVDPLGTAWLVPTVEGMLSNGNAMLKDLYAPMGYDIGMAEGYAWADLLPMIPIAGLIGFPGYYNLQILLTLFLTSLSCTLLFRSLKIGIWPALALANLAVVHPFGVGEVAYGRPTQMHWLFPRIFLRSTERYGEGVRAYLPVWSRRPVGSIADTAA
jgi:hypothetical protein